MRVFCSPLSLETVRDGKTGVLFEQPTAESLANGILRVESLSWNSTALRSHAEKFNTEVFHVRLKELLISALQSRDRTDVIAEIEACLSSSVH
jgi:hypothetical protein